MTVGNQRKHTMPKKFSETKETSFSRKMTEYDSEHESGGSSEEFTESPKSVWKTDESKESRGLRVVHHQVLRIREEDSHLGEDIGEGLSTLAFLHMKSNFDAFLKENNNNSELLVLKSSLPSSPLKGKTAIKAFH
ncbi:hypothetical protein IFM89_001231 [Coptis chinensis]|uniref:Uncharacterized protein n=1 Tax=Coptis chinensis TaxID=261450 RepID=A0A835H1T3_9MAGN|nr:hypothetical protein IFM89_001231 [Coptis chinensis]